MVTHLHGDGRVGFQQTKLGSSPPQCIHSNNSSRFKIFCSAFHTRGTENVMSSNRRSPVSGLPTGGGSAWTNVPWEHKLSPDRWKPARRSRRDASGGERVNRRDFRLLWCSAPCRGPVGCWSNQKRRFLLRLWRNQNGRERQGQTDQKHQVDELDWIYLKLCCWYRKLNLHTDTIWTVVIQLYNSLCTPWWMCLASGGLWQTLKSTLFLKNIFSAVSDVWRSLCCRFVFGFIASPLTLVAPTPPWG